MTDVLKIALERRSKLQEEVARLDEFIRTAETLIRSGGVPVAGMSAPAAAPQPQAAVEPEESPTRAAMRRATETETADATDVPRPSIIRRSSVASSG